MQHDIGEILETIYEICGEREENPLPGSYTNYLLDKGEDRILQKVGEEATELIIAAKNHDHEEVIHEGADVLYHITLLLYGTGVEWDEIAAELQRRRDLGA